MATQQEIDALADAMWQLLDDMGDKSQSVCLAAKAQARIAFEPFRREKESEFGSLEDLDDWMPLAGATAIIESCD